MSTDLLAPLARLITTAEAIEGLRDLFAAEEPLDDIAGRVAHTAVAAIPYADAVSITVLSWPDARTAASTMSGRSNSSPSSTRQAGGRALKRRGSARRCARSSAKNINGGRNSLRPLSE